VNQIQQQTPASLADLIKHIERQRTGFHHYEEGRQFHTVGGVHTDLIEDSELGSEASLSQPSESDGENCSTALHWYKE
jgi:predicted flavoprotein YhiN